MNSNDFPFPRKMSSNDQTSMTMPTSTQLSPSHTNPSQLTQNENSNFQAGSNSIDKISFEMTSSGKPFSEASQARKEERRTRHEELKIEGSLDVKTEVKRLSSESLSPIHHVTPQNVDMKASDGKAYSEEQANSDNEERKILGRNLERYQKKFPSDVQHLRTSKQISSPESKKSGYAFRRICNNTFLGETLESEFIQDPLHEKESNSKSSNKSSNENLVKFWPQENPDVDRAPVAQPNKRKKTDIQEIDSSIEQASYDNLRNSDLRALLRKKEQQMKRPVRFNVMVVGESGLGKSTFIDCFLETGFNVINAIRDPTIQIQEKEGMRTYDGVTLRITMIDTPGYTHSIKIEDWYRTIKDNIIARFTSYKEEKKRRLKEKSFVNKPMEDNRVHMILYFVNGPRIRGRDMQLMNNLKKYSSIVPIIGKGDSYTVEEIKEMKIQLIAKAYNYKIEWFDFAEALSENPEKLNQLNESKLGPCPPFLIISSVNKIEVAPNQYVYGRKYEYGVCNIENPNHSDFKLLQTLLGGHVCLEAINLVEIFYKAYHKKMKDRKKEEESKENTKNIAIGSAVAIGILGSLLAFKDKLFLRK